MKHASLVVNHHRHDRSASQEEATISWDSLRTKKRQENREAQSRSIWDKQRSRGRKQTPIEDLFAVISAETETMGVPKNWDGRAGERIMPFWFARNAKRLPFRSVFIPTNRAALTVRYARP